MAQRARELVERISISLPPPLARRLDELVEVRGFENRSQAIREMINRQVSAHHEREGDQVMAGTITIFYDESKPALPRRLAQVQRRFIDEVISSQHVLLVYEHTMEVLLVQGPARVLHQIVDELVSCKGVTTGGLTLSTTVLPPIHPRKKARTS